MQMNKQHGIKIFGMEPLCLALLYVILIVAEEKKIGINRDEYLSWSKTNSCIKNHE